MNSKLGTRLRSLTLNLGIMAGSLIVGLLIGEGVIRVAAPQQLILINPELWQPHDSLGWLRRPNVRTRINTGERTVSVFTDEHGFRIGRDPNRTGDVRVLLLGDSFMEALQVEYEQSLAGLLEEQLTQELGRRVIVHNTGVSGWLPDQYYLLARSQLGNQEYDLVITSLYVGNDVISARRDRVPPRAYATRKHFRLPRRVSWQEFIDAVLHPTNDFLEVRSQLFLFFKNRFTSLRMQLGLTPSYFPPELLKSEASAPRWRITAEICNDIKAEAEVRGTPILFVMVPAHFQVYSDAFDRYVRGFEIDPADVDLDQPNRLLGQSLGALGVEFIDALPAFRAATADSERLYGRVDTHLSPAGHVLLASLVVPEAARLLEGRNATRPRLAVSGR